ncbi:MAG: secondary thiamine-phosphate synthase enzyme YjbQ [Ruminiclostridium sp.]
MAVFHQALPLHSTQRVSFFDMTDAVKEALVSSKIHNGILVAYSQHTSCSVIIQEESEDVTYWDTQLILQDMLNVFQKIVPDCEYEGQYLHPGPIHVKNAKELRDEKSGWLLNTDAHLRSIFLGRSESIPIVGGELILGEFGRIYFIDFDQTRERDRTFRIQIVGE